MEPLKIVNRIVLQMSNDQAVVETKADLHSVEIFMIVQNWIENNQSHPRSSDAEVWLNAYELQNPNARPPRPKPVSKETQLTRSGLKRPSVTIGNCSVGQKSTARESSLLHFQI
jgi:hypothetical protein